MHVEDAAHARDDLDPRDVVLVLLENPRRQTGGVRERASGDAVLDAHVRLLGHGAERTRLDRLYASLSRRRPAANSVSASR